MDDLISRAVLLNEFRSLCGPQTGDGWDNMGVHNLIMRQKAVEAVPVVHGRWEVCGDCGITRCSACKWNFESRIDYKYCPNCGARMDG